MLGNYVPVLEVIGDASDLGPQAASAVHEKAMTLMRHLLSQ